MKVMRAISLPASACLFIFLLCLNSYADDGQDLIRAAWRGDISTVKTLLAKDVDVNAKDNHGTTALLAASGMNHPEIVQALLAKDADVNAKDNRGRTALMLESQYGNLEIVQALLAKGADVNAKDDRGTTALLAASGMNHPEIVQALLAKGAVVSAKTNAGETVLRAAKGKGNGKNLLLNPGFEKADPPRWSAYGDTAYDTETFRSGKQSGKVWAWDYGDGLFEQYVKIVPGTRYEASVYALSKPDDTISEDSQAWIQIEWFTADNAIIGDPIKSPPLAATGDTWVLLSTPEAIAPPGAAKAKIKVTIQAPKKNTAGSCYFDDADFSSLPSK